MKTVTLVSIYVASFVTFFFILSAAGIIFTSYANVINNDGWKFIYSIFFGPFISILPAREFYVKFKKQFDLIF